MKSKLFYFVLGSAFSLLLAYFGCNFSKKETEAIDKDYYIISNQISRMNKMLVVEQNFSSFQTHKSYAFESFNIFPKEMVLYSTAKAQVSYDLKKIKIKIDSVNKKLIVQEIPEAEISIYPDIKIHFMDDYIVNRFSKTDLNNIMKSAKKGMINSINQNKLKEEGKKQLMVNLNDIFVLAKYLNYSIEDSTHTLDKNIL